MQGPMAWSSTACVEALYGPRCGELQGMTTSRVAGLRQPILILSPFVWGPPRCYALKQKYHLPCPPPLLQFFLLLHMYLKVISVMRRPFHTIYVGVWSPPAPSSWPPTPPPLPWKWHRSGKESAYGPLSRSPPGGLPSRVGIVGGCRRV